MSKKKLYADWSWKMSVPAPFDECAVTSSKEVISRYNKAKTASRLHPTALRAILAYMALDCGDEDAPGAIGTQGEDYVIAEYPSRSGETHVVVFITETGGFKAGRFNSASDRPSTYLLKDTENSGAALFFALLPAALSDSEFAAAYKRLTELRADGYSDPEALNNCALTLCDNLYRRIEQGDAIAEREARISINSLDSGNVPVFTVKAIEEGVYNPTTVLHGEFNIFKAGPKVARAAPSIKNEDFVGRYAFSERKLTPTERELVQPLPDYYIIPEEVVEICEHAQKTTGSNVPMRNFFLRGPSGSGKTEGAKAIAAGLGLPYVFQTCSSDYDSFSFIGQFIPNGSEDHVGRLASEIELPSFQDIMMDPGSAWCKLTEEYDEEATEEAVFQKLIEVVYQKAVLELGVKAGFKYVDTPLVQALRYGYLCELQEPSIITNQGVVVGLNGLLDNCKSILLPTGEVVHRHPDAVIVLTTNTDYVGCRPMNQSVLSRMSLHYDVETPPPAELAKRVANITGCTNMTILERMAQAVSDIQMQCRKMFITDGCCGTREMISWAQSYMICGDVMKAARHTVLAAVSSSSENRESIQSTCLDSMFS